MYYIKEEKYLTLDKKLFKKYLNEKEKYKKNTSL